MPQQDNGYSAKFIRTLTKNPPSGKIILNLKLIQVPKKLIDYVIIHELCHLREHNHSRSFYELLERILPNWHDLRQQLNRYNFSWFADGVIDHPLKSGGFLRQKSMKWDTVFPSDISLFSFRITWDFRKCCE